MLRALAVVAAIAPMVIALTVPALSSWPWAGAALAAVTVTAVAIRLRPGMQPYMLALALAALGGHMGTRAGDTLRVTAGGSDAWPVFDLTQVPMAHAPPPHVGVRGYFRNAWTMAQYDVPPGERPDQNKPPSAVLVPFAGTTDDVIATSGPIVVARVAPGEEKRTGRQTIYGSIAPLDRELLLTLIQVDTQGLADKAAADAQRKAANEKAKAQADQLGKQIEAGGPIPEGAVSPAAAAPPPAPAEPVKPVELPPEASIRGVMVDTLDVPDRREAWMAFVLALVAAGLGAGVLLWAARARATERTPAQA